MDNPLLQTISEIDWKSVTSFVNTAGFLAYSLDEYTFSNDPRLKKNERDALTYSSILLAIAGGHYAIIDANRPSVKSEILIRYSDWLFTTPMLLKVITSYYGLSDAITYELIAYNLIMVITGLWYELTGNINLWAVGAMAYLILIFRLYSVLPKLDLFYRYFVFGWGLYGAVSLMPPANRLIVYDFLDFYNKLVFAIEIRSLIEEDVRRRDEVDDSTQDE